MPAPITGIFTAPRTVVKAKSQVPSSTMASKPFLSACTAISIAAGAVSSMSAGTLTLPPFMSNISVSVPGEIS